MHLPKDTCFYTGNQCYYYNTDKGLGMHVSLSNGVCTLVTEMNFDLLLIDTLSPMKLLGPEHTGTAIQELLEQVYTNTLYM